MSEHESTEYVSEEKGCPKCGERDMDELMWLDDERVECQTCGNVYEVRR